MVVVDARGDMDSGIFGEMMLTYFAGLGGEGVVIDGCIRDSAKARELGIGLWVRGVTPNFHAQTNIFPFAVNVPIACANTFIIPGDIIVADDDGAVVVPCRHGRAGDRGRQQACRVGGVLAAAPLPGRRPAQVLPSARRRGG